MIRDGKVHRLDCVEIDIELRDKMVTHIQRSIIHNLEAIKKFMQIPGYEDICAGIYTYAVEEYGKILYLKSFCLSPAESNTIKFPYKMMGKEKGDTGFLNHYKKFKLALRELPDNARTLVQEGGGFLSSGFLPSGFITEKRIIADFEARKKIFFADFTQDRKSIEMPPQVNRNVLEKAVDTFLTHMKNEISS
jgi:hypothetical protein